MNPFSLLRYGPNKRVAALYVSRHSVRLALATRQADGTFAIELDACDWSDPDVSTTAGIDWQGFKEQLSSLVSKWQLAGTPTALSLDGDLCVARIVTGSADRVDKELHQLVSRVPRYLSLGAGMKVTGSSRQTIAHGMDYAVTAVANRDTVQRLCIELGRLHLKLVWAEPSLVSAARLVGQLTENQSEPILLADGGGKQWDLGICHAGRLMLDYRPAAAFSAQEFANILKDHMPRLLRFCRQHRKLVGENPRSLLIYGPNSSAEFACRAFENEENMRVEVLKLPRELGSWRIQTTEYNSESVPVIGSLLPLLGNSSEATIPNMLKSIDLQAGASATQRAVSTYWPAVVAAMFFVAANVSLQWERYKTDKVLAQQATLGEELRLARREIADVAGCQDMLVNLQALSQGLPSADWDSFLQRVTQCLPDRARLDSLRYDGNGTVFLRGAVLQESLVFEVVSWLRQLSEVSEAALDATSPAATGGTEFDIRLQLKKLVRGSSGENS